MSIYKPSELQAFLRGLGVHPKKGLSQNFLIDGNIIRKIVLAADVKPGDIVLEIGPGPGALSEALLESGAEVIAVEKDSLFAKELRRLEPKGKLTVYEADILKFPIKETLMRALPSGKKAKVIANLPYHITTPIITLLSQMREHISELVIMVQEEVARRFVAKPGTSDYSSLTVFLQFYTVPKYAFMVSRKCFFPEPSVDSAIAILELITPPNVSDAEKFFEMTRRSFEQRRKMLRSSLKDQYGSEKLVKAFKQIGLKAESRPEELSLEQFVELFEALNSFSADACPPREDNSFS